MELVVPALPYLASYTEALNRGWSPDNEVSRKVIATNGGVFVERFRADPLYGEKEELRFRIPL